MLVNIRLSPNRHRRGLSLIGALLLMLAAMLAAGFTFYCGVRIVDYIRRLQERRDAEIRKLDDARGDSESRDGTNHVQRVSFDLPTPT